MISSSSVISRCLQLTHPPHSPLSASSSLFLRALRASIPHAPPPRTNENDSSLTSVTSSESTSLSIYSLTVLIFSTESFFSSSLRSVADSICFSIECGIATCLSRTVRNAESRTCSCFQFEILYVSLCEERHLFLHIVSNGEQTAFLLAELLTMRI